MRKAAIGFGANLGEPDRTFARALERLERGDRLRIDRRSSLYRSAPWGLAAQPEFLNAVALVSTEHPPRELLRRARSIEREFGRTEGGVRWGPRPLDLDLLFYEGVVLHETDLVLPHPRIAERSFVLDPLAEVAPGWRHPGTKRSVREMREELERSGRASRCHRIAGSLLGAFLEAVPCPR